MKGARLGNAGFTQVVWVSTPSGNWRCRSGPTTILEGPTREACQRVRHNRGSAGSDGQTRADVEPSEVERLLAELAAEMRDTQYRPLPVRRVDIPKPGQRTQQRTVKSGQEIYKKLPRFRSSRRIDAS
ncbi:MAG: hypothetical protein AB7G75_11100 [Candidatus Binatia bacterium]